MSGPIQLRHPQPALWRADGVLQIGITHPLVLNQAPPDAARLIELLTRPHTRDQLAARLPELPPPWINWVCRELRRAELLRTEVGQPSEVAVWGTGALAQRIVNRLSDSALPASRLSPEGLGSLDPARLVVVAGEHAEPDRAVTTQLRRANIAQLIVRLEPERAVVGPLVVPGESSCIHCSDLQLTAQDASWPRLLAQLCAYRATPDPLLLDWATATAVTQIAAWVTGSRVEVQGRTLELGVSELRLRARTIPVHPDCGCCAP